MTQDSQQNLKDDKGSGVTAQRSTRSGTGSTQTMCNENCDQSVTDNGMQAQVTHNVKPEKMEEMVTPQQHHDMNSVNE